MEKYNALDNLKAAYEFRSQLILEIEDLRASLDYLWHALNADDTEEEEAYIAKVQLLIEALTNYIGERLS